MKRLSFSQLIPLLSLLLIIPPAFANNTAERVLKALMDAGIVASHHPYSRAKPNKRLSQEAIFHCLGVGGAWGEPPPRGNTNTSVMQTKYEAPTSMMRRGLVSWDWVVQRLSCRALKAMSDTILADSNQF
ncbi:hypothetical protein [Chromobacterium sp. ASV23]|uniref:hypothetical protein n=1 Tax=Chromobacterium sp. ASV23 TaxID=2795110 RepID=UPI0018ED3D56|nr:hypothetical protein [Chromobacterium sp. ASV23]